MAARAQIPLAAILALLGAQSYLFLNQLFGKRGCELAFYAVLLTLSFVFVCRAAVLFFKVLSGQIYKVIPTPGAFESYRAKCLAGYAAGMNDDKEWHEQWAAITVRGEMATHLADCAAHNGEINDLRSEFSWKAHRSLMISVALTAVVFVVGSVWTFYSDRRHSQTVSLFTQGEIALVGSIGKYGDGPFHFETSLRSMRDESIE